MKKIIQFLLLLLSGNSFISQADTWTQKAAFPGKGRELPGALTIGNKGYINSGWNGGGLVDNWEYDPVANTWTSKASFPGAARCAVATFTIGNKGYVACGYFAYKDLWEYDPLTNTWTQKADCGGVARGWPSGFSIGLKGYVCCGYGGSYLNDLWEYDPVTNTWLQKKSLPAGMGRRQAISFSIGTKGYIGTGENNSMRLNDLWEYDQPTDTWTQKTNLPGATREDAAGFSICGKGYVATGGYPLLKDLWEFDPLTNQWTQKTDFPGAVRDDFPGLSIGSKGYVGLGDGTGLYTDFWEYTPDHSCSSQAPPVASFQANDTLLCENDCISLTDKSNNADSYQWLFPGGLPSSSSSKNPGVCYMTSGIYSITLIASNSTGTDTLKISNYISVNPSPPTPNIQDQPGIGNDTLICITDTSYKHYQWYFNNAPISNANDTTLVVTQSGNYNVEVTGSNGCKIAAGINIVLGLQNRAKDHSVSLYPNPAENKLIIDNGELIIERIDIYNTLGMLVLKSSIANRQSETEVDVSGLPAGIYFVQLVGEKERWTGRFVKK